MCRAEREDERERREEERGEGRKEGREGREGRKEGKEGYTCPPKGPVLGLLNISLRLAPLTLSHTTW